MPGSARWLTPGRSSCGSIWFIVIYLFCSSSASSFFFSIFFLPSASSSWSRLPFWQERYTAFFGRRGRLPFFGRIGRLPFFGRRGRLPFLAGLFPRGWGDIACMREGCSGGVFVICHCPNQGWESTHRLHLYPLGGVFHSPWYRAPGRRDLFYVFSEGR